MARHRKDVLYRAVKRLSHMSGKPDTLPGEIFYPGRMTPDELQMLVDMGAIRAEPVELIDGPAEPDMEDE